MKFEDILNEISKNGYIKKVFSINGVVYQGFIKPTHTITVLPWDDGVRLSIQVNGKRNDKKATNIMRSIFKAGTYIREQRSSEKVTMFYFPASGIN